jgi:hypothetical protein
MDVCDSSMKRKSDKQDKKDFNSTNGSKGKTQELIQKKIPPRAYIFVSCFYCVLCT